MPFQNQQHERLLKEVFEGNKEAHREFRNLSIQAKRDLFDDLHQEGVFSLFYSALSSEEKQILINSLSRKQSVTFYLEIDLDDLPL